LRKAEASPSTDFNCEDVKGIYENLYEIISRHNITSCRIFKLDETGNSTFQVYPKIICAKGSKLVENVSNGTVIAE